MSAPVTEASHGPIEGDGRETAGGGGAGTGPVATLTAAAQVGRSRMEVRSARVRRSIRLCLVLLLGLVLALGVLSYGREVWAERVALAGLPPAAPGVPNVLLIVLDTVRADRMSLYGYQRD